MKKKKLSLCLIKHHVVLAEQIDSARQSCPILDVHPASGTMGTWSVPRVKRPGRCVNHPPLPSAEVKVMLELCLCALMAGYRMNVTS
jgi:hypothetical protein